jgi:fatty-acyl-CoA synthase
VTGRTTVGSALERAAATSRGLHIVEHDGRTLALTYGALRQDALNIGGALLALELHPGDRVALVMPEVSEFIRAFFGITAAGLVPVPLVPPAQAGDVATFTRQSRHVLAAARVAAVVTSTEVAPLVSLHASGPRIVPLDALRGGPALQAAAPVDPDAIALLQFTSGSTAAPKGVVLSHANLDANIHAILTALGTTPSDVGVSWLPLHHDMGLIGMLLSGVFSANDMVLISPVLFLKRPSVWLACISEYHGTVSFAPNFAYELCLRRIKPSQVESLDLSSWRVAGCGAEPIRPDTLTAFAERFAPAGFRPSSLMPSYGLAEHSLAVTFSRGGLKVDTIDAARLVDDSRAVPAGAGAASAVRVVSCGRPFPGHAVEIVDDRGRRLPDRSIGQIVARGASVMRGYFDNAAATAETLRQQWLYTGDLGYLAGGELFVCGRTKDLIIRHGRKYHPPDLEAAITDLRGIPLSGVVVFGISHVDEADEVVAVLEARASGRSDDLEDRVRRRVRETAGLELDRVLVTPPGTIPRTTSGKVRRAETRARLEAGTLLNAARGV